MLDGGLFLALETQWVEIEMQGTFGWAPFVTQEPYQSAESEATTIAGEVNIKHWLNSDWGLQLYAHLEHRTARHKGDSEHVDTVSVEGQSFTYDLSVEKDMSFGIGLDILFRL